MAWRGWNRDASFQVVVDLGWNYATLHKLIVSTVHVDAFRETILCMLIKYVNEVKEIIRYAADIVVGPEKRNCELF